MANHGEQYGRQTDEYGNPIHRPGGGVDKFATGGTESYANQPGATGGGYGTHGGGTTGTTGAYPTHEGVTGTTGAHGTHGGGDAGAYGTHGGGTTGAHGTHGGGIGHGTTDAGLTTAGGAHRRSGSSSSSSESDGEGGRRKKKGLGQKIKEKLPGGHKDEPALGGTTGTHGTHGGTTGTHGGTTAAGGYDPAQPEKKGIMDKIKDKLPGGHH